jgi:hypothetical protein
MNVLMLGRWLPVSRRPDEASRELRFARALAAHHRLTLAFITDDPDPAPSVSALRGEFADIEFAVVPRGWKCLSSAVSLAAGESGTLAYFRSTALSTRLADRARTDRFDLCCVSSSSMIQYALDLDSTIPIVVDFGDVDSQWWLTQAGAAASSLRARFYRTEATRLRMAEAAIARRAAACLAASPAAARVVETLAPGVSVTVIGHGGVRPEPSHNESAAGLLTVVESLLNGASAPARVVAAEVAP